MTRGFGLISLLLTLAVIGVIAYVSMTEIQKSVPPPQSGGENSITAPIDAAKQARNLIEERSRAAAQQLTQ